MQDGIRASRTLHDFFDFLVCEHGYRMPVAGNKQNITYIKMAVCYITWENLFEKVQNFNLNLIFEKKP